MSLRTRTALFVLALTGLLVTPAVAEVEVVCHRGANEVAPENTYAAAQRCIDWGCHYVEIDVRTSQDGVFYIIHDATVDRTTDGQGRLRDLTSAEIDQLDAGSWFAEKFAGERVPRLEPFLRWIQGKAKVYFDVKDADLEQLISLVQEVGLQDDCFFWFGNPLHAAQFRKLTADIPLKVNVSQPEDVSRVVAALNPQIVEMPLDRLTEAMQAACREHDVQIMVYHPSKDAEAFAEVIRRGADMINLNHGDLFLEVQRELTQTPMQK